MILHADRNSNDCKLKLRCHCIQILHLDIYSVGCWQSLPLSVVQLKGKHCWNPIALMKLYTHSVTEPYRDILKLQFLITSGYYIVPSLSTALVYVHSGTRPLLWYAYRLIFLSAQWNAFLFLSGPVQSLEIWGEQVKVILRRFVCIRNKKGQTFVGILVFLILFF